MIQIYSPGNTDFTKNGDMVLMPSSCVHTAILKGQWEIEIDHPKDDEGRWRYIVEGAVLSVPTFMGEKQLFRLYEVEKGDIEIQAYGRPIFFDSANNVFLLDVRPTNLNGQQALTYIMNGTGYTGESDIIKVSTAYYVRKNLIEAINGNDAHAFINRWGGEPLYRNYHIIINETAGDDNNVQVRYGKNISSITETINMDDVITRIVPISYNGHMLSDGNSPWVDSPLINSYPIVHTKLVKFENIKLRADLQGDPGDNDIVCDTITELRAALLDAANDMFADGCDRPYVTMDVDMVDLAQTEEYKEYAVLETVRLGDTVHCIHRDLGIDTTSRVTEIQWDCIHNCVENVLIGQPKTDYFSGLQSTMSAAASVLDSDGNIMAERVRGLLDAQKVHLGYQLTVAERSDVRAILFEDLDSTSPTFGALAIGTQGIEIAHQRNTYDTDWVWTTAIDFQTIHAENIIAGLLSDVYGNNWWNLNTGEFNLSSGTLIDDDSGKTIGGMQTQITTNANGISAEITNRQNADSALDTRITANANGISAEITNRQNGDNALSTRITANATGLSTEITDRTNADNALSTRITANANEISTKITSADAQSLITQNADSIRLKANAIAWTSTNSSMTANGVLTATGGNFSGTITASNISGSTITSGNTGSGTKVVTLGNGEIGFENRNVHIDTSKRTAGWFALGRSDIDGTERSESDAYSFTAASLRLMIKDSSVFKIVEASASDAITRDIVWLNWLNYGSGGNIKIFPDVYAGALTCSDDVDIDGSLTVDGTKSRKVITEDYASRLLYSYETPKPLFGDLGEGIIGNDGNCYISIDPIFAEAVSLDHYHVFLQAYGDGTCFVYDKKPGYFVVKGTAGLSFAWEIKAMQRDYENYRLEDPSMKNKIATTDYGALSSAHVLSIRKERAQT